MITPEVKNACLAEIHDALERLSAAATSLFNDWQVARSLLPGSCRKLMDDLNFLQAGWLDKYERSGVGTSKTALASFEGFAAEVHKLVVSHAESPEALVSEVFETEEEERLFFRHWKQFLDGGIGTIARTFQIDDVIFAGQIAASMRMVECLRRITADWTHLSPEHRRELGRQFRENAQALSDAYGTASSTDFILMKERFAERLDVAFETYVEVNAFLSEEGDRDAALFRAAAERFSKGVVATVKSVVTACEQGGPNMVRAYAFSLAAGECFLELPWDDETMDHNCRSLLNRLLALKA